MYGDTFCPGTHCAAVHFNSTMKHFARIFCAMMNQLSRKSESKQEMKQSKSFFIRITI